MQFATLVALAAALVGVDATISFSETPSGSITVGDAFNLKWTGADVGAPVTITLKQGQSDNLQTVALLTGNGKDGHYLWTPSKDLVNGDDYALEISQGVDETNYSGKFTVKGGKAAVSGGYTTVTITSGASSYITTESGGASTGTAYSITTRTSNLTVTTASPTGGIQVSSSSAAPSSSASGSSTNGVPAAVTGSLGGLAAAIIGAVALL